MTIDRNELFHGFPMARWWPIVLLLLIPVHLPAEKLAVPGVYDTDDRVLVTSREFPWSAIGRLNNTLGPHCTGTLVGPRLVLTAAHCLWNPETNRWLPPCALHFLSGYGAGEYIGHSLVVSYTLAGEPPSPDTRPGERISSDWALLLLDKPLGAEAGFVDIAPISPSLLEDYKQRGGMLVQAGYSRDSAHALTMNRPCKARTFKNRGRLLLHECDTTFGDSGSPLLLVMDSRYRLVALVTGISPATKAGVAITSEVFRNHLQEPQTGGEDKPPIAC